MVSSEISLNVLDLILSLVDGFIQTDIYSKPTDHHIYLLRNSAHPTHCTKAIPFGVATRVRRNCSTNEKFEERSKEYQNYLVDRGYHPQVVKKQFDKAKALPREDILVPKMRERKVLFPLVVDFNPHLPNISKIIKSHIHLTYNSPTLAEIFPKGSIIPPYRRAKNIKELLAGRKRSNYNNHDNSVTVCCKCNSKCDFCKNYFKESKIFHSAFTNRFYTIRQNLNYKSRNVIYVATCKKCNVQYVGSTANEFKVRFRNHKSARLTNKSTCELAIHFNKEEHHMSDFEFIVIEKIVNESDNKAWVALRQSLHLCRQKSFKNLKPQPERKTLNRNQ